MKVAEVKKLFIENIRSFLFFYGITYLDVAEIGMGDTPILKEDNNDDDNTFTLDSIEVDGDKIILNGSSAYENDSWKIEQLSADVLEDIDDWLKDYEEEIKEYPYEEVTEEED